MNRSWNMRAEGKIGEIDIFGPIGESYFEDGITAQQFLSDLRALGDVSEIDLRILSPGGSMIEGHAIFNALVQHPARVRAFVDFAASMAGVVAMAADEIHMAENGFLMLHNPWTMAVGDADEMRKSAELLDKFKALAIPAYQRHAKLSDAELSGMMDAETWLTAAEAKEFGFISMISPPIRVAASLTDIGMANAPEAAKVFFDIAPIAPIIDPPATAPLAPPVPAAAVEPPVAVIVPVPLPAEPAGSAAQLLAQQMRERDADLIEARAKLATASTELESAQRRIASMTAGFEYRPEVAANVATDIRNHPYFLRLAELQVQGMTQAQASVEIDKTEPGLRADLIRRANRK